MTYTELIQEISDLYDANDAVGIINLITIENLVIISACVKKPFPDASQQLTDIRSIQDAFIALESTILAAPNAAGLVSLFTPENVQIRGYGLEYTARLEVVTDRFTTNGVASPEATAITALATEADELTASQNTSIPDPCL